MDKQDECIRILSSWIIERKRKIHTENIKTSDNPKELLDYKNELEVLEHRIRKAIYLEDVKSLEALGWPSELMECIKDISIRVELMDIIYQAFCIHHFNRSPIHEEELHRENAGLR